MRFISLVTLDPANREIHDTPEEYQRMERLVAAMRADGTLIDTGGRDESMLDLRVIRKGGRTTVTDGPFTEGKEIVGGYALLEARDRDHAVTLANRFLDALGYDAVCSLHEVFPAR